MNRHSIQHTPDSEDAYATDKETLRLVLKVGHGEKVKEIGVLWNNKYDFCKRRKYARMRYLCEDGERDYYVCELKSADARYAYIFLITEASGAEWYYSEEGLTQEYDFEHAYYTFFQYAYNNAADIVKAVEWAKDAVFYQIFPDRFRKGKKGKDERYITQRWDAVSGAKDFAGGDLKGITEKLGSLKEKGFNALYLTPVFLSPSNHKYNVTDYLKVDPMFGDEGDLKELIQEAHRLGMKVVTDAVFNHCDESNAMFADVKEKGRESEYYDCFLVRGDRPQKSADGKKGEDPSPSYGLCNYEIFANCPYMPKWNTSSEKAREYLIHVALTYLSWGFDGLRLDVADELSHVFRRELRQAVKERYPEAILIGEVWHENGMYLRGDEFDGVMNYKLQKVYADYFGGKVNAEEAAGRINRTVMSNRKQHNEMMLNFLDNHDLPRFLRVCGEDEKKLRAALGAMYFTEGMPCVMYGTELPLTGDGDPDCRRTYDWTKAEKLGEYLKELSEARRDCPKGEFYAEAEDGRLVLIREGQGEKRKAYFGQDGETEQRKEQTWTVRG